MREQRLLRAAEKAFDHLPERLRPRLLRAEPRPVDVRAAQLSPLDHSLARQPVHDRHDRRVGARAARRQRVANLAHRALADRPESIHAIEFERRKIEHRALRQMRQQRALFDRFVQRQAHLFFESFASPKGRCRRRCGVGALVVQERLRPQQRPSQRGIALRPNLLAARRIERRVHSRHLRIQIVDEVQRQRLRNLRQRRRTELVRPMMAQDQVLQQHAERFRKSRNRLPLFPHQRRRRS